eukprot:1014304-Pelagomonas_calceolata.AAC.1
MQRCLCPTAAGLSWYKCSCGAHCTCLKQTQCSHEHGVILLWQTKLKIECLCLAWCNLVTANALLVLSTVCFGCSRHEACIKHSVVRVKQIKCWRLEVAPWPDL